MSELIMTVGLPGSGKSTWAKGMKERYGYETFSSDEIRLREGITGQSREDHAKVFTVLDSEIISHLKSGGNAIYDATNLSRKLRKAFLDKIKDISCTKSCHVFIVSPEICKGRNSKREGLARVPEEVIDRMLLSFNAPYYYEGWDDIILHKDRLYEYPKDAIETMDQENPHHRYNLGDHMRKVYEIVKEQSSDKTLLDAARYHDIGKYYTKTFMNSKGERTKEAHYYSHDNVGAYYYLMYADISEKSAVKTISDKESALKTACIINWHMIPFLSWKQSGRAKERDRKLLGEELYNEIFLLHEADKLGSGHTYEC